jgi:signal transduction histidine kinase
VRSSFPSREISVTGAVARFVLGSLVAIVVVLVGGFFALRGVAVGDAEDDIREQVQVQGRLVQTAGLTDGVLTGDPEALAQLDEIVVGNIVDESIVRVKLWTRDGRILYSDEPRIIGERFELGEEELELFSKGGAEAELSDLAEPENRYERQEGKLLEAHTAIRTPDGTQVLFEVYRRFGSIDESAERLLSALAPPLLGGLFVLLLLQVPLAWRLAGRLQQAHAEREGLLQSAVQSSANERRQIAADLHDGVVQDLAGVAFGLAPIAEDAERRGAADEAGALRQATDRLRQGVRDLRTLLVEIHPPALESAGLESALSDLLSPLQTDGVDTSLQVDDAAVEASPDDPLLYRVAREAVRNTIKHAGASRATIALTAPAGGRRLVVADDGRGFTPADRERRGGEGHVGLSLLESLVAQAGGRLEVQSAPGEGTTLTLELPPR